MQKLFIVFCFFMAVSVANAQDDVDYQVLIESYKECVLAKLLEKQNKNSNASKCLKEKEKLELVAPGLSSIIHNTLINSLQEEGRIK